jgi:hypothetical protein
MPGATAEFLQRHYYGPGSGSTTTTCRTTRFRASDKQGQSFTGALFYEWVMEG